MKVTCTKREAAVRQIDVAIALLLTDGDPLAVRTLAAAAHGILADLAENQNRGSSWRTKMVEDSGLSKKDALQVLNAAQNYLKHADRDPDSTLSFDEEENDHLLFVASLECGELGHQLSFSMQAFQIWYLALYPEKIGHDSEPVITSKKVFPGLSTKKRSEQLALGHEFLERALEHKGLL
ncbi:hypothetical protein SCL_1326 [Sulfuricaulis limicola]|uniref:Uncharacterized protein n=1 Tax=Sulfuricaulis limicola TaxID=1620215 RepID=A0A1B4XFR6_9GAMM|nr:hypothetical protein [Sulfuricaulis limicola]BAV33637.1 hypothetical protein SCL_1326 [Sulfuricaulis limicola]